MNLAEFLENTCDREIDLLPQESLSPYIGQISLKEAEAVHLQSGSMSSII